MRLLLAIDSFFPGTGGAECQVALLGQLLRKRGHEVRIVAPRLDPDLPTEEIIDGTRVTRIDYPKVRVLGSLFLIAYFMWFLLRERHNFDAIHVHIAKHLAAAAGAVRPWLNSPVLVKISGAWEFDGGVLDQRKMRNPAYALARWLIKRNDAVQSISAETSRRLRAADFAPEKIETIPNAIALPPHRALRQARIGGERSRRVVYVGRLEAVKGVDVLLRAWRALPSRAGIELHFVGDGRLRPELERYAGEHGLSGSVHFHGWLSNVRPVLDEADLYVQPSLSEGLPNAVLEAMAASLPVVATRVSGNEDLVAEGLNGYLVAPADEVALTAGLQRALDPSSDLIGMGKASRKMVEEHYGSDHVIPRLEAFYGR